MWNDFKNFCKALYILLRRIVLLLFNGIIGVYKFLLPLEGSVKGVVNPEEFYRILLLALSTGGGLEGFVKYLEDHFKEFVTDPVVSVGVKAFCEHCHNKHLPIIFFIIIFLGDYLRRKNHGVEQ